MSKVTLDIICTTAFSYDPNSLHDPHNELACAYEKMIDLQSGPNIAWMILLVNIPGFTRFIESKFAWRIRKLVGLLPVFSLSPAASLLIDSWLIIPTVLFATGDIAVVVESMTTIRGISRSMLEEKLRESHASEMEQERKKDIMSLLVRARKENLEHEPAGYSLSDEAMMDQVVRSHTFLLSFINEIEILRS